MLLAEQWVSLVCGSDGYPRPLVLEVEERATSYEFLELIVSLSLIHISEPTRPY